MKRVKVFADATDESASNLAQRFLEGSEQEKNVFAALSELELVFDFNEETGEMDLVGAGGYFLGDEEITPGEIDE